MSQPLMGPQLTPHFCFNQTVLRDFLRLSRATIDDSIVQNLNGLHTPSRQRIEHRAVAHATPLLKLGAKPCTTFKDTILFPSWQARADVISYCAGVASSPDPDDPDAVARAVESAKAEARVVDERLDPYSGRYRPREGRTEVLANVLRNEQQVEQIIRARTWALVNERCEAEAKALSAEEALERWRQERAGKA